MRKLNNIRLELLKLLATQVKLFEVSQEFHWYKAANATRNALRENTDQLLAQNKSSSNKPKNTFKLKLVA